MKRAVKTVKDVVLTYRWGRDVNAQIKALADNRYPSGEVVVFLLNYAIAEYKKATASSEKTAITLSQEVSHIVIVPKSNFANFSEKLHKFF